MSFKELTEVAKEALDEYRAGNVHITPLYPAILVRVIPKQETSGTIWLPKNDQHKPIYEGIVIATYAPKTVIIDNHSTSDAKKAELLSAFDEMFAHRGLLPSTAGLRDSFRERIVEGFSHPSTITLECELRPGDHFAFPHWSGEAVTATNTVPGLNPDEYRLIPDKAVLSHRGGREAGEPLFRIDYDKPSILDRLMDICEGNNIAVDALLKNFDIIPRDQTPKIELNTKS